MSDYPFKSILLATEHTEFDIGAERVAFEMARLCGIPLRVVLPLLSNSEYEAEAPQLALRAEQQAAKNVDVLHDRAKESGVRLDIHIRRGEEAYQEIVAEAVDLKADLIVIRRRGKPGFLANMLVGEMVSKVIKNAPCAVLTVPRAAEFWRHGILAAVNETPAAQKVVSLASAIATACDLPLTIVSVAETRETKAKVESFNNRMAERASLDTRHVQSRVLVGKPVDQVLGLAKEISADLMVIGRQRYSHIPFSLGGSSAMQQIAGAMDIPTLVVSA